MNTGNKPALFYITDNGLAMAKRLNKLYPDARVLKFDAETVSKIWQEYKTLIFIMAAGIVVRTIAPLLKDKKTDPAVVVLDEKGRFSVSLLSGHLGGANERAREIANFLNSERGIVGGIKSPPRTEAVITTASDVNSLLSIDLWALDNNLIIEDWKLVPQIGARLLNSGALRVYTEIDLKLPEEFLKVSDPRFADIFITNKKDVYSNRPTCAPNSDMQCSTGDCHVKDQLYLRPGNLVLGIGCNSRTSADEIEDAVKKTLDEYNLALASIQSISTIDIKAGEPGLISFAQKYKMEIASFTTSELNSVKGVEKSEAAFKATGANAVAEPAALLAAGAEKLLVPKQKIGNVTVAAAEKESNPLSPPFSKGGMGGFKKGKIYIVGTGPGSIEHITPYAQNAIRKSDVIVGYGTYLELIQELIKDKEVFSTGMTHEIDRCRKAVELAINSRTVAVISGGDPGIYAMAGLVFELIRAQDTEGSDIYVEVIPGISALNACASRLGAPLMHDFASISLSDRLTQWELIEKRLEAAAMADFVIILYNPRSMGRAEHINRAQEIILKHRSPDTPVGIVKGAMRENEKTVITDLRSMLSHDIDMQTTVIIGNSKTFSWNNLMITPRGYENKFQR